MGPIWVANSTSMFMFTMVASLYLLHTSINYMLTKEGTVQMGPIWVANSTSMFMFIMVASQCKWGPAGLQIS